MFLPINRLIPVLFHYLMFKQAVFKIGGCTPTTPIITSMNKTYFNIIPTSPIPVRRDMMKTPTVAAIAIVTTKNESNSGTT